MTTTQCTELDLAAEALDALHYRDHPDPFGPGYEREWITADGVVVAHGDNGMCPTVTFLGPWPGTQGMFQGEDAELLMTCGLAPWTGGPVRIYAEPYVLLVGMYWPPFMRWSGAFRAGIRPHHCVGWLDATHFMRSHPNIVGIILDDCDRCVHETQMVIGQLRQAGCTGPVCLLSEGDAVARERLYQYTRPAPAREEALA